MIVYSQKRYYPDLINTIILQDSEENYFYVHRSTYDAAVILNDRYTKDTLLDAIGIESSDIIDYYFEQAPTPLNILAPFLGLVAEGLEKDIELLTGCLHVISSSIDFRKFVKAPKEIRSEVNFSLFIREEYKLSWERFFNLSTVNEVAEVSHLPNGLIEFEEDEEEDIQLDLFGGAEDEVEEVIEEIEEKPKRGLLAALKKEGN